MKSRKIPHISIIPVMEKNVGQSDDAIAFISNYLREHNIASTEILDPADLDVGENARSSPKISRQVKSMRKRIKLSVGVLIVAPEFYGEYPSHVKTLIDFLYDEWHHKPVAISTYSSDILSKAQVIKSLQFALWKVNSWTLPVSFQVPVQRTPQRNTDLDSLFAGSSKAPENPLDSGFQQVFDNYCNKYIQLCTRIEYAGS